jgi:CMP-N,N'-diacetyllegionaminic acid synthase
VKILALIPARGGSKGLPGKNILPLDGHPLIAYSIMAALRTPGIDRVLVTTDSDEIAAIARKYGAETPFLRPSELAQDETTDLDTFQHALFWLAQHQQYRPDAVFHLRPTTPIRFESEMNGVISLLAAHPEIDSIRSVAPSAITPYKMWILEDEKKPLKPLLDLEGVDEPYNLPRQKLPTVYLHTGTYDLIRTHVIQDQNSMTGKSILPWIQDENRTVDIDYWSEFQRAEKLLLQFNSIRP